MSKPTVRDFRAMKDARRKITMITCYDAVFARIVEEAGCDMILVGDSAGSTICGCQDTVRVTMEEMLIYSRNVRKGAPETFIVGDMPMLSYQINEDEAMRNAGRFIRESGCDAVKLEGGREYAHLISRLTNAGIPVMGHIGLLPQKVMAQGGYRKTGKTPEDASRLLEDAKALEEAGVFAIVAECMDQETAAELTESVSVPVIGIGAGSSVDGQVQVLYDVLGMSGRAPAHARVCADIHAAVLEAVSKYIAGVKA